MKTSICGDRHWKNYREMSRVLKLLQDGDEEIWIVHDDCIGADKMAEKLGYQIKVYPADWSQYGRAAGLIRNSEPSDDYRRGD